MDPWLEDLYGDRSYDVMPDGSHFLMFEANPASVSSSGDIGRDRMQSPTAAIVKPSSMFGCISASGGRFGSKGLAASVIVSSQDARGALLRAGALGDA